MSSIIPERPRSQGQVRFDQVERLATAWKITKDPVVGAQLLDEVAVLLRRVAGKYRCRIPFEDRFACAYEAFFKAISTKWEPGGGSLAVGYGIVAAKWALQRLVVRDRAHGMAFTGIGEPVRVGKRLQEKRVYYALHGLSYDTQDDAFRHVSFELLEPVLGLLGAGTSPKHESECLRMEQGQLLQILFTTLSPEEEQIVTERYLTKTKKSFRALGRELNVSAAMVQLMEVRALRKMRVRALALGARVPEYLSRG